ncbi:cytochrome c biogenesis CcdA family protein [uncultured Phycicoccus sp.]|uniref:cytochrome c biogenesis CcdA family protein n=1 Tax=uncultured Phycicoccus sp. TaxID=661422 RepID=UPI00262EF2FD|nr:cytochrome c biogenesis protein CcdA [uncultured Phycicoccus sp.]
MLTGTAALALAAGMLAALNPCGFALLPAYLSLLVTGEDPSRTAAVVRALRMTVAMTAGFTAAFAVFGAVVAPVASSAQRYLPWFSVLAGAAVFGAGLWLVTGHGLVLPAWGSRPGRPVTRSLGSMFGFGVSYALASLTCTIAPFLAVVVSSFRAESPLAGLGLFALYAAGMGLVVGSAALAVALARSSLVRGARRVGRRMPLISGSLLLVVGAYVAYYGWWEIRVLGGAGPDDPVIEAAAQVQQSLAQAVAAVGPTGFVVVVVGALASIGAVRAVRLVTSRRR